MSQQGNSDTTLQRSINRRRVLQALGAAGVTGAVGASQLVSAQSEITLEGVVDGWRGVAPGDIEGETNPTLTLGAGEEVTVEWTNGDGLGHNFAVVDSDGNELVSSDIIAEEGSTQTVEFTASEDMVEYLCQPHPNSMNGSIQIEGGEEENEEEEEEQPSASPFTKVELTEVDNGMKIEAAPDGRIFYTTRGSYFEPDNPDAEEDEEGGDPRYPDDPSGTAEVGVIDPNSEEVTTALELDVYAGQEDGLQGITFDPDFEDNGWVYLFYSPPNEEIAENDDELESLNQSQESPNEALGDPYNRVSRFTVDGDTIDPDSEVEIIRIHNQRERCCHVGGDLVFDNDGYLLISTGDDTESPRTEGYNTTDEREGQKFVDAQRTSGNTADLRGKILRICPHDDGSYSIPDGNLFPEDEHADEIEEGLVRPEIYVMGVRNPFTMKVDRETNVLYYGEYAPDARETDDERGPPGFNAYNWVTEAHNAGWPYVRGPRMPYREYDYEAEEPGEPYDPDNLINDSPNNTGLEELPPVQAANIWYPGSWDDYTTPSYVDEDELPFDDVEELPWVPEIEGGAPMTGPVFRSEHVEEPAEGALPDEYEGKHFIAEFNIGWIKTLEYDGNGELAGIEDVMPDEEFALPQDLELGPDGALYVLEYGEFSGRGGTISRLEYTGTDGVEEEE